MELLLLFAEEFIYFFLDRVKDILFGISYVFF